MDSKLKFHIATYVAIATDLVANKVHTMFWDLFANLLNARTLMFYSNYIAKSLVHGICNIISGPHYILDQ